MAVEIIANENCVKALLSGEIDHHNASGIRLEIDEAVQKRQPTELELDFGGVTFMDSSAIGLVIGRYRMMNDLGGKVRVTKLSNYSYKVMSLAGMDKLVEIKKETDE